LSSRGEYFFPVIPGQAGQSCFQVSSYDIDAGPWGCLPDKQFAVLDRFPAVLGEFVWSGFDYLGEPYPYISDPTVLLNFPDPAQREVMRQRLAEQGAANPPSRSSYFGIIDLAGFPKDRYYAYQARWRPDVPVAHLLPHWNWPERIGQITPVHLYTNGDEAELFLNGRSLGRKRKGYLEPRTFHDTTHPRYILDYRIHWDDVVYEPGELRVVVYRGGKEWAEDVIRTTGEPTQVILEPDRHEIAADGRDLCFVTVRIADGAGRTVPTANHQIRFELEGGGIIAGVDNGDPTNLDDFRNPSRRAFHGLCLFMVRAQDSSTGTIRVKAFSEGLTPGRVSIELDKKGRTTLYDAILNLE
jgi:beta-galactosidase